MPMLTEDTLAQLLRDAEQAHAAYERQVGHADADWPSWYARYMLGPIQEHLAAQDEPASSAPATSSAS